MRDLYRLLPGAGPQSTPSAIRRILSENREKLSDRDVADIEAVLLNPERKRSYDRVRKTLITISETKRRLHGIGNQNWGKSIAGDFFVQGDAKGPQTRSDSENGDPAFSGWGLIQGVVATIVIVGVVSAIIDTTDTSHSGAGAESATNESYSNDGNDNTFESAPVDAAFQDQTPLSAMELCEAQERLATAGYYRGDIDGLIGPKTKQAFEEFASEVDTQASGATRGMLNELRRQVKNIDMTQTSAQRPQTGYVVERGDADFVAPFRVRVPYGNNDYYVKMVDARNNAPTKSFYMRAGSVWETEMPIGRYNMKYAIGIGWYGSRCLFGADTTYYAADEILRFSKSAMGHDGYEVELVKQLHGNLGEVKLTADEF